MKKTGRVTAAAKKGELSRQAFYDLAERDPDFKIEWEDAEAQYLDTGEAEAWRRGMDGVLKRTPYVHVISADEKETRFHEQHEKSDRLLEFCLKNRHPNFKPTKVLEVGGAGGGAIPVSMQPNVENLTDDELKTLVHLQRKLHEPADPIPG